MQGRWTIGKKLFTGVGVLIALLMASGATTLWTTRAMNDRLVYTGEKTVRRIRLAERAQAEPLRMYIAEQMMLLARAAGDKALHDTWKARFDGAQARAADRAHPARRPAGDGPGQGGARPVQAGLGDVPEGARRGHGAGRQGQALRGQPDVARQGAADDGSQRGVHPDRRRRPDQAARSGHRAVRHRLQPRQPGPAWCCSASASPWPSWPAGWSIPSTSGCAPRPPI